jgi:hypothetical protein
MTREQAEAERKRMAEENPEVTWLVAEQEPGQWAVVKVGLKPPDTPSGELAHARPKPPDADDPRPPMWRDVGGPWGGGG